MTKKFSVRLIALPLSKKNQSSLIYFYAQQQLIDEPHTTPEDHPHKPSLSPHVIVKKATDLGAKQWNKLALSPQNSWKFKIYTTGERFMDKIPFEEWALKSIDPGTLAFMDRPSDGPSKKTIDKYRIIELLYPGSLFKEQELMEGFQSSMAKCQPYHRKWMKLNILLSPLTLPVGVIPLIPNLPFFYMMWRAWSHWRAYNASRYLNHMIEHGQVQPTPCPILDGLYTKGRKTNENRLFDQQEITKGEKNGESIREDDANDLILSHEMLTELRKKLDLPVESGVEILRGIHQARLRSHLSSSSVQSGSSNHSSTSL